MKRRYIVEPLMYLYEVIYKIVSCTGECSQNIRTTVVAYNEADAKSTIRHEVSLKEGDTVETVNCQQLL